MSKGGFESIFYTISIFLYAMMFGGIMGQTIQLRVVVDKLLEKSNSARSLIAVTILTAVASKLILCEKYLPIVITGKMYARPIKTGACMPKTCSGLLKRVPR